MKKNGKRTLSFLLALLIVGEWGSFLCPALEASAAETVEVPPSLLMEPAAGEEDAPEEEEAGLFAQISDALSDSMEQSMSGFYIEDISVDRGSGEMTIFYSVTEDAVAGVTFLDGSMDGDGQALAAMEGIALCSEETSVTVSDPLLEELPAYFSIEATATAEDGSQTAGYREDDYTELTNFLDNADPSTFALLGYDADHYLPVDVSTGEMAGQSLDGDGVPEFSLRGTTTGYYVINQDYIVLECDKIGEIDKENGTVSFTLSPVQQVGNGVQSLAGVSLTAAVVGETSTKICFPTLPEDLERRCMAENGLKGLVLWDEATAETLEIPGALALEGNTLTVDHSGAEGTVAGGETDEPAFYDYIHLYVSTDDAGSKARGIISNLLSITFKEGDEVFESGGKIEMLPTCAAGINVAFWKKTFGLEWSYGHDGSFDFTLKDTGFTRNSFDEYIAPGDSRLKQRRIFKLNLPVPTIAVNVGGYCYADVGADGPVHLAGTFQRRYGLKATVGGCAAGTLENQVTFTDITPKSNKKTNFMVSFTSDVALKFGVSLPIVGDVLSVNIGLKMSSGSRGEAEVDDPAGARHLCTESAAYPAPQCSHGRYGLMEYLSPTLGVTFLFGLVDPHWDLASSATTATEPDLDYYYHSLPYGEFKTQHGSEIHCPHRAYAVKVWVLWGDTPVEGAVVEPDDGKTHTGGERGTTDKDGYAILYLPKSAVTLKATAPGDESDKGTANVTSEQIGAGGIITIYLSGGKLYATPEPGVYSVDENGNFSVALKTDGAGGTIQYRLDSETDYKDYTNAIMLTLPKDGTDERAAHYIVHAKLGELEKDFKYTLISGLLISPRELTMGRGETQRLNLVNKSGHSVAWTVDTGCVSLSGDQTGATVTASSSGEAKVTVYAVDENEQPLYKDDQQTKYLYSDTCTVTVDKSQVAAPTADPSSGLYFHQKLQFSGSGIPSFGQSEYQDGKFPVTITSATEGAAIRYTMTQTESVTGAFDTPDDPGDGNQATKTLGSDETLELEFPDGSGLIPFRVYQIKAVATKDGFADSEVSTFYYVLMRKPSLNAYTIMIPTSETIDWTGGLVAIHIPSITDLLDPEMWVKHEPSKEGDSSWFGFTVEWKWQSSDWFTVQVLGSSGWNSEALTHQSFIEPALVFGLRETDLGKPVTITATAGCSKAGQEGHEEHSAKATCAVTVRRNDSQQQKTIRVLVNWDDANNQDGIRPDSVSVTLLQDDKDYSTVTLNEANNWRYSFRVVTREEGKEGAKHSYSLKQNVGPITGYTTTYDGYTVMNRHETGEGFKKLKVTKEWKDDNNKAGKRPETTTVLLLADGLSVVDKVTLRGTNNWTGELIKPTDDSRAYSVLEVPVEGYRSQITGDETNGYTITNTYSAASEPEEGKTVQVRKVWDDGNNKDGLRPASVTVLLLAGGISVVDQATLSSANSWTDTLTIPQTGKTHSILEVPVEGYETEISGDLANGFLIVNTRKTQPAPQPGEKLTVSVRKVWDDGAASRPLTVLVTLLADGKPYRSAGLSAFNKWKYSFTNLDPGKTYTIQEEELENYTPQIDGDGAGSFLITNKLKTEGAVYVAVEKRWEDSNNESQRPTSVTIRLWANGVETKAATLNADGGWQYSFTNLPASKGGKEITYTLTEDQVEHYTPAVSALSPVKDENGKLLGYTATVTNTYTSGKVSVSVRKVWEDDNNKDNQRPESVTVKLLEAGAGTDKALTLNAENNWQGTFTGLNSDEDYTVSEEAVDGYETSITGNTQLGYTITNTRIVEDEPYVLIGLTWDDNDNQDGKRPENVTVKLLSGGETIKELPLTEAGYWIDGWEGLELESGKTYSVQAAVDGYEIESVPLAPLVEDNETVGYLAVLTAVHTPETVCVEVNKVWADENDRYGRRPGSVTVHLLSDGQDTGRFRTLTAGDSWKDSFTNLPKYRDGTEITYAITEDPVSGYTETITGSAGSGFTVTNTLLNVEDLFCQVEVVWNDGQNQDGLRPDSVAVTLSTDASKTLTSEGGWHDSFTGLDEGTYTVSAAPVSGYTCTVSGTTELRDSGGKLLGYSAVVTYTHTPATTYILVSKVWSDNMNAAGLRPDSVTVKLLSNGKDTGRTLSLNASGGWRGMFSGLPVYGGGKEIQYTVVEEAVGGYQAASIAGSAEQGFTVTNVLSHTEGKVYVEAAVVWEDDGNRDGKRPGQATVRLLAEGKEAASAVLTDANGWEYSFNGLEKRDDYVLEQTGVDGKTYTTSLSGLTPVKDSGGTVVGYTATITNYYTPETVSVSVRKRWDDHDNFDKVRPSGVSVRLLANGTEVEALWLDSSSSWAGTFSDLPRNAGGQPIDYTVREAVPDGYTAAVTGSAADGFTIVNTRSAPETRTISITQVWKGEDQAQAHRPGSVAVKLLADGADTGKTVTLTAAGDWKATVTDLPRTSGGSPITYTVAEEDPPNYRVVVTGNMINGFTIQAIYQPREEEGLDVDVYVKWEDDDNRDGKRPDELPVILLAGAQQAGSATLSGGDGYKHTFKVQDLSPTYSIKQFELAGYTVAIENVKEMLPNQYCFVISCSHTPETVEIPVAKVWADSSALQPASVTIHLLANDVDTDKTLTLNDGNGWKDTFTGLKYEKGHVIAYTVAENAVGGYTTEVTGTAEDGFTVTNTAVAGSYYVQVSVQWNDSGNQDGRRPASLTVKLDGQADPLTLAPSGNWQGCWNGLDSVSENAKITVGNVEDYTISPSALIPVKNSVGVVLGYKALIICTHPPETIDLSVSKVWDDNNNSQGLRPDGVVVRLLESDETVVDYLVLSSVGDWEGSFAGLPKYRDGKEIAYTVKEEPVSGYTSTVSDSTAGGFIVTNTLVDKPFVKVSLKWEGGNALYQPDSLKLRLAGKDAELSEANGWSCVFTLDSKPDSFNVSLDAAPGYRSEQGETKTITGANGSVLGYEIEMTNTYTGITVNVFTVWEDDKATHPPVTVSLWALRIVDGVPVDISPVENKEPLSLTEAGEWTGVFEGLPPCENYIRSYLYTASARGGGQIANLGYFVLPEGGNFDLTDYLHLSYLDYDWDIPGVYDFLLLSSTETPTPSPTPSPSPSPTPGPKEPEGDPGTPGLLNTSDHMDYLHGYGSGLFHPAAEMTRAEVAQMFYNLLLDRDVAPAASYDDVPEDAWYAQVVDAMRSLGIMEGTGNNRFAPERPVTRAEFTATAMRFTSLPQGGENLFSDVRETDWFYDQVVGAIQYGWINGYSDGTFRPNASITRAETAKITNRLLGRSADEGYVDAHTGTLRQFSDVKRETCWAYYEIMEAANAHFYNKTGDKEVWTG